VPYEPVTTELLCGRPHTVLQDGRRPNADRHVEYLKLDAVDQVLAVPIKDGLPRRVSATLRVRLREHERSVGKTVGEVVEVPALVVEPVTDLLGSESGQQ